MLDDNSTIFMCGSGNLIPSGLRRLLAYVVKNRFVDVLVLSGKVLFHDIHETLGRRHFQAQPGMLDDDLEAAEIFRIGDTLANQDEYREVDEWIGSVINQLDFSRPYSVREFLHLLGRELAEIAQEDGVLTSAFKARVPVFCPDLLGSEMAIGIARSRFEKKTLFNFDLAEDTLEMMTIMQRTRNSGIITLGNLASQDLVNMTELAGYITRTAPRGHKYAISISTDSMPLTIRTPSVRGMHRSVFGRLHKASKTAFVDCDPSIAVPLIVTSLSQTAAKFMKGRKRPSFSFAGKDLIVDVP
jgi:deoxyhypusine synthase